MAESVRPRQLPDLVADLADWMRRPGYDHRLATVYGDWSAHLRKHPSMARHSAEFTIDALGHTDRALFWVTPEMGDLLAHAAKDLPGFEVNWRDAPGPSGFAWFDEPIRIKMFEDRPPERIRGLLWFVVGFDVDDPDDSFVFVSIWGRPDEYDESEPPPDDADLPPLVCFAGDALGHQHRWDRTDAEHGLVVWPAVVLTLFRLIDEPYIDQRPEPIDRACRRRAHRLNVGLPDDVRIVTLRRRAVEGELGEGRDARWSHRWLVQGHWRNQWYPTEARHAPKWIPPYVKGPDDKPFVPKTTVNVLRR